MKNLRIIFLYVAVVGSVVLFAAALPGCEKKDKKIVINPSLDSSIWMSEGGSFLGVYLEEINAESAKKFGLKEEYGALVKDVVEDSPAAKAGIKKDDVIVEWNNSRVESAAQLRRMVKETPEGRTVRMGLMRDGGFLTLDATLSSKAKNFSFDLGDSVKSYILSLKDYEKGLKEYEGDIKEFKNKMITIKDGLGDKIMELCVPGVPGVPGIGQTIMICEGRPRMGVALQPITPQLGEYFGVKDAQGVLISSVIEGSAAEKAGLKAGDVIISIDGKKIEDAGDVVEIVHEKAEGTLRIVVVRDKQEKNFTVILEKKEGSEEKELKSLKHKVNIDIPEVSIVSEV